MALRGIRSRHRVVGLRTHFHALERAAGDLITLAGQFVLPSNPTAAPQLRVGGLSGLASIGNGRELLALADDRDNPRVFRMAVSADANAFRVDVERIIYLHPAPAATRHLDPEGIAVTREGHMLITSEGVANDEARLPPTITEHSSDGQFIRR